MIGMPKEVRTESWTKLLFLDFVYTQVGSFHQVTLLYALHCTNAYIYPIYQ